MSMFFMVAPTDHTKKPTSAEFPGYLSKKFKNVRREMVNLCLWLGGIDLDNVCVCGVTTLSKVTYLLWI